MTSLAMQLLKAGPEPAVSAASISAVRIWAIYSAIFLAICSGAAVPGGPIMVLSGARISGR